jgi:hypothetical protein
MEQASGEPGSEPATSPAARVAVILGFALHIGMGVLILVSGLIMPYWAVGVLAVIWVIGLIVAIRGRARPSLVLAVPFAMLAIWILAAWGGDRFLDWTA